MCTNYDYNRKIFNQKLIDAGISHGSVKYRQLSQFLNDPINSPYLQIYYLLCAGYLNSDDIIDKTQDLVDELEFITTGHYSYRKLFAIDFEWYQYFNANAWPTGQRRTSRGDYRRGVNQSLVDEIMKIKVGPPQLDLENAIIKQMEIKHAHVKQD
jgi:hypothetical protein